MTRISSAGTRSRDAVSPPVVQRKEDVLQPDVPPWDRSVDVVHHRHQQGDARRDRTTLAKDFERNLAKFTSDRGCRRATSQNPLSRLPAGVRFRIGQHIVRSHGTTTKPISLNRRYFTRDCWGASDLTPLGDVLVPLAPCLLACWSLYADVMLALLSGHRFHATFSPYVGPRLCPLATTWLNKYGVYMRSIIVEVDYTRLGLGLAAGARGLGPGLDNLETLLRNFGDAQEGRHRDVPLESLTLLCRRFYGERSERRRSMESTGSVASTAMYAQASRASSRSVQSQRSIKTASSADEKASTLSFRSAETHVTSPDTPTSSADTKDSCQATIDTIDWDAVNTMRKLSVGAASQTTQGTTADSTFSLEDQRQYCPEAHFRVCNHVARLGGRVDALRMCGFSDAYTDQLAAALFPQACSALPARGRSCRVAPSTAWPSLPGQAVCVDAGQGRVVLLHGARVAGATGKGPFILPPLDFGARGATTTTTGLLLGGPCGRGQEDGG